jgi:hypothetical protein
MRLLILLGADGHHRYRTNTCDVDLRTAQKEPAASGRRWFQLGACIPPPSRLSYIQERATPWLYLWTVQKRAREAFALVKGKDSAMNSDAAAADPQPHYSPDIDEAKTAPAEGVRFGVRSSRMARTR